MTATTLIRSILATAPEGGLTMAQILVSPPALAAKLMREDLQSTLRNLAEAGTVRVHAPEGATGPYRYSLRDPLFAGVSTREGEAPAEPHPMEPAS